MVTMASSTRLLEPTKLRSCASVEVRKLAMKSGVVVEVVALPEVEGRVWDESLSMGEEDGDDDGVDREDARGYCRGREGDG